MSLSRKVLGLATGIMLLSSLMGPAVAVGEGPTFRTEQNYFKCANTTKVENVNWLIFEEPLPGWSTTAPDKSVQAGAGCGTADPSFLANTTEDGGFADATWQGTFTGNLKAITVEAHNIYLGATRATGSFTAQARLWVDGQEVALPARLTTTTTPSSSRASEKITFSITGLNFIDRNLDGTPADGNGTTERRITLQLRGIFLDGEAVSAWVWGTTEVPAGVTFNPGTLAATQIQPI